MFKLLQFRIIFFFSFFLGFLGNLSAQQVCPPNMGFEYGNFNHWELKEGWVDTNGEHNLFPTNYHTLYNHSGDHGLDHWGLFPKKCPNGSGHSIQLGDDINNKGAYQAAYTLTVPTNQNNFSIIFHFAIVLQNPNHTKEQQPKFTCKVYDVTEDRYLECASFQFIPGYNLTGFFPSPRSSSIFYRPWSPVTLDLSGLAGKTLRLEFTSNDCSLGGHWGYTYLDIDEECFNPIKGNSICKNDPSVTLTAPLGFASYRWFDAGFTTLLGTQNTLTLAPPPTPNTVIAVEVTPFPDIGCLDTIYTTISAYDAEYVFKVIDTLQACHTSGANLSLPSVTAGSTSTLKYSYFFDAATNDYLFNPFNIDSAGTFYIKAVSPEGCTYIKPVTVKLEPDPNLLITEPPPVVYPTKVDLTSPSIVMGSTAGSNYSYWQNHDASTLLNLPNAIDKSGIYYIKATSAIGCTSIKPVTVVINPPHPFEVLAPNAFSPNGDGINDIFKVGIKGLAQLKRMLIFNRWGQVVFETYNLTKGWDGTHLGKPLSAGTYYWVVDGTDLYTNTSFTRNGSITLIH